MVEDDGKMESIYGDWFFKFTKVVVKVGSSKIFRTQ